MRPKLTLTRLRAPTERLHPYPGLLPPREPPPLPSSIASTADSTPFLQGTLITGLLVPSNDPSLALGTGTAVSAPFVIAIQNAGIKALPSIINACLLTSAWSAASSDLYTSSRALYGLALNGQAPGFLKATNRWGLPYWCVIVGVAFSLLSYMSAGSKNAFTVFGYFANVSLPVLGFQPCTARTDSISWLSDDLRLRSHYLVGYLPHRDPLLRRSEGPGHRPQDVAVPRSAAALPRVLWLHLL